MALFLATVIVRVHAISSGALAELARDGSCTPMGRFPCRFTEVDGRRRNPWGHPTRLAGF